MGKIPEIEVAIALGINSVWIIVLLMAVSAEVIMDGFKPAILESIPVGTIVIFPLTTEAKIPPVGIIVAFADTADKASGNADLSMAGRAEARAFGKLETISAKADWLMFAGTTVAIDISLGRAVTLAEAKAEETFPDIKADAVVSIGKMDITPDAVVSTGKMDITPDAKADEMTAVGIEVMLLLTKIEDNIPELMVLFFSAKAAVIEAN